MQFGENEEPRSQ